MVDRLATALLPRVAPGQFFAPQERRVLVAAAQTLLEGSNLELAPERVARNIEEFLLAGRSRRAWRIRVLCLVIELAPMLLLGRRRFSRLGPAQRRRLVAERFIGGRGVWALCAKIRHLVYLGAYGDERAAPAVGFVPWPERPRYRDRRGKLTHG